MIQDTNYTKNMSNEELIYEASKIWIDEIVIAALKDADEIMSNDFTATVIRQAVEHNFRYEKKRREALLNGDKSCWYEFEDDDRKAYQTILYDCLFRKYGANCHA